MLAIEEFGSDVVRAWQGDLSFNDLLERAAGLEAGGYRQLSAVLYQTWLNRNASPFAHAGYFNLGAALTNWAVWQLSSLLGMALADHLANAQALRFVGVLALLGDRKSTRLNSSH